VDTRLELCNPDPHNCRATFLSFAFQWTAGMIHDAENDKSHAVRHHDVTTARTHRLTAESIQIATNTATDDSCRRIFGVVRSSSKPRHDGHRTARDTIAASDLV
jgi:hypothetical protein